MLTVWRARSGHSVGEEVQAVKKAERGSQMTVGKARCQMARSPRRTFCLPSRTTRWRLSPPSLSLPSIRRRQASKSVRKWKPPQVFLAQCSSCETTPVRSSCPALPLIQHSSSFPRFKDYSWQKQVNLPAEGPDRPRSRVRMVTQVLRGRRAIQS